MGSNLASRVIADLAQDKPVRLEFPHGGRLHLDRQLPFLCVYRRADDDDAIDRGTEQLVTCEACYMIIPPEPRSAARAIKLLREIVQYVAKQFGSFLLIETWSDDVATTTNSNGTANGHIDAMSPRFEIVAPSSRIPRTTIEALSKSLGRDLLAFGGTKVTLGPYQQSAPLGRKPLLRMSELKAWNCFSLGIVASPIYRDGNTQDVFPAVLRSLRHHVHSALEQAYFAFTHKRTSLRTPHYHALGGRTIEQPVLDIDRQLVDIAKSFDLLLQAMPVNAEASWLDFRRTRFEKSPTFFYRPLPIDPVLLKRQLYLIPVERIEDPTLSYLFRQKQEELDRQITLLSDVDSPRFLPESLQLYGGVSDWLLRHAVELLDQVPTYTREEPRKLQLDAKQFAKVAQQELGYYQQQCADFSATVAVRDDMYPGLMVSGDQLLVGGNIRVAHRRVDALLQHEVGTHLVTRYNGHHQPFRQLEVGLAGYDGLQEGLAVLSEYLVGGLSRTRMRILAARVVAARHLLDGATFVDTFRTLDRTYEFSKRTAYTIAMRIYRGGGLTKDAVYLRGLLQILRYLREGGDLEPLFVGKVASTHLPLIFELSQRQVIKPPILRPRYLENPESQKKLEQLRAGLKLMDLLAR